MNFFKHTIRSLPLSQYLFFFICSIHAISIYIFLMVFAFNSPFFCSLSSINSYFYSVFATRCWQNDTKKYRHLTSNWNIFLLAMWKRKKKRIKCFIMRTLSLHICTYVGGERLAKHLSHCQWRFYFAFFFLFIASTAIFTVHMNLVDCLLCFPIS